MIGHVIQNAKSLGMILITWNDYELTLEIAIRNLLGLSSKQAHIVLGGLMFLPKLMILKSLAHEEGLDKHPAMQLVGRINKFVERNSLIHGFAWHSDDEIGFVKRTVAEKYVVKERRFEHAELVHLGLVFSALVSDLREELGLTQREITGYRRSAESRLKRSAKSPAVPSSQTASRFSASQSRKIRSAAAKLVPEK